MDNDHLTMTGGVCSNHYVCGKAIVFKVQVQAVFIAALFWKHTFHTKFIHPRINVMRPWQLARVIRSPHKVFLEAACNLTHQIDLLVWILQLHCKRGW